jgi:hypothetical protein
VGNNELGVYDALFHFEVEDAHAAEVYGAMTDGSGCGAVDAHLREEGWEAYVDWIFWHCCRVKHVAPSGYCSVIFQMAWKPTPMCSRPRGADLM